MLSSFFHFFVSDIFVPSLFLSPTFSIKPYCISDTYESLTDAQEEFDICWKNHIWSLNPNKERNINTSVRDKIVLLFFVIRDNGHFLTSDYLLLIKNQTRFYIILRNWYLWAHNNTPFADLTFWEVCEGCWFISLLRH